MAEAGESLESAETQPVTEESTSVEKPVESVPEVQAVEPDIDSEREPGGAAPEAVRARKEYRRRKDLEDERDQLIVERAKAEERARLLEERIKETSSKPPEAERIFSKAELRTAVNAGQITQEQADEYEERVLIPHRVQEVIKAEREQERKKEPLGRAQSDIQEYLAAAPELRDRSSQSFTNVAQAYRSLVELYGLPDNEVTQALAIQHVMGPIEKIKAKSESDKLTRRNTPPVTPEALGGTPARTTAVDLSKAPETMVRMWNRTNTSEADRLKEFRYWQNSKRSA